MAGYAMEYVSPLLSQRGVKCIVVTIALWVLAATSLGLRLFTNFHVRKRTTASDGMIIAAFLVFCGHAVITIHDCFYGGIGFHAKEVGPAYARNSFKLALGQQTAYAVSLGLTKWSICYLLTTIFPLPRFRTIAFAIGYSCILWAVMTILIAFLICRPLSFNWDPRGTDGVCGSIPAAWMAVGILDVVFDVVILLLPLPMLAKLRMRWQRKCAVGSVFVLGIITICVGIIRTTVTIKVNTFDFTYDGYYVTVWSTVEPPVAIIVACLMTLRPLHQRYWPRIRDALGLPTFCADSEYSSSYESYTYGQGRNSYRRASYWPAVRDPTPQSQIGTAIERIDSQPDDFDDDDGTTARASTAGISSYVTPSHSIKMKKNRRQHGQAQELSDSNSDHIPEDPFNMGATPALAPDEGPRHHHHHHHRKHSRHDSG